MNSDELIINDLNNNRNYLFDPNNVTTTDCVRWNGPASSFEYFQNNVVRYTITYLASTFNCMFINHGGLAGNTY